MIEKKLLLQKIEENEAAALSAVDQFYSKWNELQELSKESEGYMTGFDRKHWFDRFRSIVND